MSEPWYKNDPPGAFPMTSEEVIVLPRKPGPDTKQATKDYTEFVLDEVEHYRGEGWEGYIAPEGHQEDKGMGDQWVWDVENPGAFLEAIYFPVQATVGEVKAQYDIHRGQGWQFPLLFCFPTFPQNHGVIGFLMNTKRSPWLLVDQQSIGDPIGEDDIPTEDPDADYQEVINDVEAVLLSATDLRENWVGYKRRRQKLLRRWIIRPLDDIVRRSR